MGLVQLQLSGLDPASSWYVVLLLTHAVHVVCWACVALVLSRWYARRAAYRNLLFGIAVLAPLLTAPMQSFTSEPAASSRDTQPHLGAQADAAGRTVAAIPHAATVSLRVGRPLLPWLTPLLAALVAVGLIRMTTSLLALRGALAGRGAVRDARLRGRFRLLAERMGQPNARLTESATAPSPFVVLTDEVCIPAALMSRLSDAEVDAVLAHELAHIERRDGLWIPLIGSLEQLLWFHPLHRWLGKRCRDTAELAADDRAVEITHSPHDLARAITLIAEAHFASPMVGMLPSMATRRGVLRVRLHRLLAVPAARTSSRTATGSIASLGSTAFLAASAIAVGALCRVVAAPGSVHTNARASILDPLDSKQEYAEQMDMLAGRAFALERLIKESGAPSSNERTVADSLQLEQDLRHTREMQAHVARRYAGMRLAEPRPD